MGFLKKITRPISRVLDKVIPNEIKPALPFLAAAAPFMAPGLMSLGGNTMLSRALISGGLNLGSQLAQEGSEGDFSALSLAMASGIGALSGGGPGKAIGVDSPAANNALVRSDATGASKFFADKAASMPPGLTKSGLGALESSANYLSGVGETLRNNPFSMEGLKAAMVPVGQATTDLAVAEGRRLEKQQIIDDALAALDDEADAAARASAIRLAMQQYGFTEDEITETIASAGYADGGRVGLKGGGMDAGQMYITEPGIMGNPAVMEKIENMREFMIANPDIEDITDYSEKYESKDPDFEGIKGAIFNIDRDKKNLKAAEAMEGKSSFTLEDLENKGFEKEPDTVLVMMEGPDGVEIKQVLKSEALKKNLKIVSDTGEFNPYSFKDGGLMNLGGREMDMRGGGFIPIGKKERADDVPARLSKNEFVMTADAVRAAGGGSVNKGAKRMYDLMNNLEARV